MESSLEPLARFLPIPGRFVGHTAEYSVGETSATVCWLPDSTIRTPGKTTIFNTIWLNERVKEDLPTELVDYIFLHENGHARRSRLNRLKFLVLALSLALTFVVAFCLTIAVGVEAVSNPVYSLETVAIVVIIGFSLAALAGEGHRRVLWNEELRAELNVAQALGPDEYQRRHDRFEELRDRRALGTLRRRLFYPSADEVVTTFQSQ